MKKKENLVNVDNNGKVKVGFIKRGVKFLGRHKIAAGTAFAVLVGGGLYLVLTSDKGEEAADKVAESIEKTVESVTDAVSK